ncbi:MAG: hypothetical protein IJS67_05005, partial [Clostridia bacterium]|nr:hypothetical protein [Clostridia bacterium]
VEYSKDYDLTHDNLLYPGKDIGGTNMTAISSTTSGKVTTKLIDLSTLASSDYIMQWIPATMNITKFTLKLIDAADETNYIQVNFEPNYAINYGGTSYGSTSYISYTKTTGEVGNTGGVYAYGAVMGDWHGLLSGQMFNGGDGYNAGDSWEWFDSWYGGGFTTFFVKYDYETGNIITPRKGWDGAIELPSRKPFSSSKVYAELYWESSAAGGVAIKTVAGLSTTAATVAKQTPTIKTTKISDVKPYTKVTVPDAEIYCYTHLPAQTVSVYYDNNGTWTDKTSLLSGGKFTPDKEGTWKVVYTADSARKEETFTVSENLVSSAAMVEEDTGVSVKANRTYPAQTPDRYPGAGAGTGVSATSSTTSGSVTSKLIDLSGFNNEYIFGWYPLSRNITQFTVTLYDANLAGNYVRITYSQNLNMLIYGAPYGSNSTITYINESGYEVETAACFEHGAVLGDWEGLYTNEYLPNGLPDGSGEFVWADAYGGDYFTEFFVKYDYESGRIITPRKAWTEFDLKDWKGFSGDTIIAELAWESTSAGGVLIKSVAGVSLDNEWVSRQTPTISIGEMGEVYEGTETEISSVKVYCYTHEVELNYELYYLGGNSPADKTSLIKDGTFVPDEVGEWKIVVTAADGSGVSDETVFTVERRDFDVEEFEYTSIYFVGENWSLIELTVNNMGKDEYEVEYLVSKNDEPSELLPATLSDDDIGEYLLTYEATSVKGATYSVTKSFAVRAYPTVAEYYEIEEGLDMGDVALPDWGDCTKSVYIYEKGDANETFVSPYNLSKGVYVLEITLSYEGREQDVELVTTLKVGQQDEEEPTSESEEPTSESEEESDEPDSESEEESYEPVSETASTENSEPEVGQGGGCSASAGTEYPLAILALLAVAAIILIKRKSVKK